MRGGPQSPKEGAKVGWKWSDFALWLRYGMYASLTTLRYHTLRLTIHAASQLGGLLLYALALDFQYHRVYSRTSHFLTYPLGKDAEFRYLLGLPRQPLVFVQLRLCSNLP